MSKPIEPVPEVFAAPYVHHRTIRFGDSDAARIAYTVRLFDFAIEAIEGWFDTVLGNGWYDLNTRCGVGTPFVHAGLDMRAPLTPGDRLAVTVLVVETGRSSVRFRVIGERQDGVASFTGDWVCSFIDTETMRAIAMPDAFGRRIAEYRERCPAVAGAAD